MDEIEDDDDHSEESGGDEFVYRSENEDEEYDHSESEDFDDSDAEGYYPDGGPHIDSNAPEPDPPIDYNASVLARGLSSSNNMDLNDLESDKPESEQDSNDEQQPAVEDWDKGLDWPTDFPFDPNDQEQPAENFSGQSINNQDFNDLEDGYSEQSINNTLVVTGQGLVERVPDENAQPELKESGLSKQSVDNEAEEDVSSEEDDEKEIDVLFKKPRTLSNDASETSSFGENSEGESVEVDIETILNKSTATKAAERIPSIIVPSPNMSLITNHQFQPQIRNKKPKKVIKEPKVEEEKPDSRPNHQKAGSAFVEKHDKHIKFNLGKNKKMRITYQAGDDPVEHMTALQKFKYLDYNNVQDLVNHLAKIILVWPEDLPPPEYDEHYVPLPDPRRSMYPESYFTTTTKEKLVLLHAENFRRQYESNFPYRRPLVIAPRNEVGVQKLFPTYLSPSVSGYPELFDAKACAQFFKDFLIPEIIVPHTCMPTFIRSHLTLTRDRMANSYEFSIMVASFLIGAGYNAYVVDGYASKEMTTLCVLTEYIEPEPKKEINFQEEIKGFDDVIPSRGEDDQNEFDDETDSLKESEDDPSLTPPVTTNYEFSEDDDDPPKSHYEKKMHDRYQAKILKEKKHKMKAIEEERAKSARPPPPDPLYGLRLHAWILLLPGSRDVEKPVFIDPYSAKFMSPNDPEFHGIEAVFNSTNYYLNMQDMWPGSEEFSFDINDPTKWNKLLDEPEEKSINKAVSEDEEENEETEISMSLRSIRTVKSFKDSGSGPGSVASSRIEASRMTLLDDEDDEEDEDPEEFLEFPTSWTPNIWITREDYKKKFPQGKKIFEYENAVVELAAPLTNSDGRVKKIIKFTKPTRNIRKIKYIDERYMNRHDKLQRRLWIRKGRMVHEFFDKGRNDSLKEHIHVAGQNDPEENRRLIYYAANHPQNVSYREVLPKSLVERFEKRQDFLSYRFTEFDEIICDTMPKGSSTIAQIRVLAEILKDEKTLLPGGKELNIPKRKILRIIEKYDRNLEKEPTQDVAEKHMLLDEERIRLFYHYGEESISRNSLEFFKPRPINRFDRNPLAQDKFRARNSKQYRADPLTRPMRLFQRLLLVRQLEKDQIHSKNRAWLAEQDIYKTVKLRVNEDYNPVLNNNLWRFRRSRGKSRNTASSSGSSYSSLYEYDDSTDEDIDFLSPYLYKYGLPKDQDKEIRLKNKIAYDFRKRVLNKAQMIINEFKKEGEFLKERLEYYDENQEKISQAKEADFKLFYKHRLARMKVIEMRLERHKEIAPQNYIRFLISINKHPQLNRFTHIPQPKRSPKLPPPAPKIIGYVQRDGIYEKCPNYFYQWMNKREQEKKSKVESNSSNSSKSEVSVSDSEADKVNESSDQSGGFQYSSSEKEIAELELVKNSK